MKIISDPAFVNKEKWKDFVLNHPMGSIFHMPEMYDVYSQSKGHEPVCVFCISEADEIIGLILAVIRKEFSGLLGFLSSRSIILAGSLNENHQDVYEALFAQYHTIIQKKVVYSEIRIFNESSGIKSIYTSLRYKFSQHLNIIIDLNKNPDQIFLGFSQDKRWEIRKSIKKNVLIEEINTEDKLKVFYSFIQNSYQRIKIPSPDFSLIHQVFLNLVKKRMAKFYLAKLDEQYIASHSVLLSKKQLICWYGGLDRKYSKFFPYEALIWESLKWGAINGFKEFDFQGAGKPGTTYGVRDFKKRFGGETINPGRHVKIHHPFIYKFSKLGLKIWQLVQPVKNKFLKRKE